MSRQPHADFFQPGYRQQAERAGIEADYPVWQVSVSCLGRWYAHRREPVRCLLPGLRYRPVLGADDAPGLLSALSAFGDT